MTATGIITTTDLATTRGQASTFARMVKIVFSWFARRWAVLRARHQMQRLNELDDHMLRDLGLHRGDIYTAIRYRGEDNPTHVLDALANARRHVEASRLIC